MAAQDNLIALYKQDYINQIKHGYNNTGTLRKLVTIDSDVNGISKTLPLIGIQTSYERFGGEYIQPNQPVTSNVVMTFKNYESTSSLPEVEQYKMNNPTYISELTQRQSNAIVNRVEQVIVEAFGVANVLDQNSISVTNIDYGYRINGDGSAYTNPAAEQVLGLKGLLKVKEMFDDMGIDPSDRMVYTPSNALFGLMTGADKDQFTNRFYTDSTALTNSGMIYDQMLGLNIIVGQKSALGGLQSSGAGTYAYAFTRDTVQLNISESGAGAAMWFENINQSWMFIASVRSGAVVHCPSTLIKIACKTAV